MNRKGSVIETTFTPVSKLTTNIGIFNWNIPLEVVKSKNLITNDSLFSIRMTASDGDFMVSGYIDETEIDNTLNYIKILLERYLPFAPLAFSDIQIDYLSDSHFEISCFKSKNNWVMSISPKSYRRKNVIYLNDKESMLSFFAAFKKAAAYIKEHK